MNTKITLLSVGDQNLLKYCLVVEPKPQICTKYTILLLLLPLIALIHYRTRELSPTDVTEVSPTSVGIKESEESVQKQ